ncbi:MAG: DUF615 domain-containing protein [Desulfobulbaceae bacterium]|uniref:DUF615 domain-containing protein n=1 Tax=Candidatus Desulfatifera sulfidica TaxID=2841691 RepID=A0A8J6TBX2_9BACT|nr:DUF615 domain-containing protein [Candidatus Desulfatifera sulfidica]
MEIISRSEQKRRYRQVEELARELSELSDRDIKKLPEAVDLILEEVRTIRGLKTGARKRQIKYLAKHLHEVELTGIYEFLRMRKGSQLHTKKKFHLAERLRDDLVNEAIEDQQECRATDTVWEPDWKSEVIRQAIATHPSLVERELRKAIHQYVRTRNMVHYRELFRMIKTALEQEERRRKMES